MPLKLVPMPQRDRDRDARGRAFAAAKAKLKQMGREHEKMVFSDRDVSNHELGAMRQKIRQQMNLCWHYNPCARLRAPFNEEDIRS